MVRSKSDPPPDALREEIRAAGLRVTAPRVAVLLHLRAAASPVTHGELADELAPQGWDRATIYRNLTDLTEAGLARRTDLGDHVWRFEAAGTPTSHASEQHPHFVCSECGDVACLPEESVKIEPARGVPRALRRNVGLEIRVTGRCDRCA